jgi:hypothetical protein
LEFSGQPNDIEMASAIADAAHGGTAARGWGTLPQGRNRAAALPRAANTYLCVFETRYGG